MAHILVIDDDQDIQRLLQYTLKRAGHTVEVSADGVNGLAQAEAVLPDLIVCDVMMPKMTGYEFCKKVRANPQLKDTPIIVFSARFQPVDRQTALEAGATEYLPKSVEPNQLVQLINDLLPADKPEPPVMATQGMVAVFSLRGGAGVTSLAVNLAIAVALSKKTKTTVVDLAQQGGHTALLMGVRPTSSVSRLLASTEGEFTPEALQPHLIQHRGSGVQLFASDPNYGNPLSLDDERLLQMMQNLKSAYPVSILDLPHILEPHVSPVLKLLDQVVLVLTPDMPSVQSTAIALQGLGKLAVDDTKIKLVLNQISPHHTLPAETIQKVVKRPITGVIPFEANMIKAANSGQPLLLNYPQSQATRAIVQLAGKLFS